jgi:hypothetical protein
MNYETLVTEHKKEADYEELQRDLNKVEAFIDKCLKFVCESTSTMAERDFNVSSL